MQLAPWRPFSPGSQPWISGLCWSGAAYNNSLQSSFVPPKVNNLQTMRQRDGPVTSGLLQLNAVHSRLHLQLLQK